jgi:8-oxo-dGTP pyrophosphatase MutT (NUDIX family)
VEVGETVLAAARRELSEETGICIAVEDEKPTKIRRGGFESFFKTTALVADVTYAFTSDDSDHNGTLSEVCFSK